MSAVDGAVGSHGCCLFVRRVFTVQHGARVGQETSVARSGGLRVSGRHCWPDFRWIERGWPHRPAQARIAGRESWRCKATTGLENGCRSQARCHLANQTCHWVATSFSGRGKRNSSLMQSCSWQSWYGVTRQLATNCELFFLHSRMTAAPLKQACAQSPIATEVRTVVLWQGTLPQDTGHSEAPSPSTRSVYRLSQRAVSELPGYVPGRYPVNYLPATKPQLLRSIVTRA